MTDYRFGPPHNRTTDGDGFFISYNWRDIAIYGDETTAVVVGQMAQSLQAHALAVESDAIQDRRVDRLLGNMRLGISFSTRRPSEPKRKRRQDARTSACEAVPEAGPSA